MSGRVDAKGREKRSTSKRCYSKADKNPSGLLWRQLSGILPLFPPPLPEAGRRRGLPGSAARARAGSEGSARRLGPRRGALGRGSVNIHEAPPLLRGSPDPGVRRPPLCPGLVRSLLTRGRGLRGPAPQPRAVRERRPCNGGRGLGVRSQATPRPAPAGPGLSAPREGVGRGGGRRTLPLAWPGRPGLPLPRSPSARLSRPAGTRAASRGRTARAFLLDPPPSTPPPSPPLPGDARGLGVFGPQSPGPGSQAGEGRWARTGWYSPGPPET